MNKIKSTSHMLSIFFYAACLIFPLLTAYFVFFHLEELLSWVPISLSPNNQPILLFTFQHRLLILLVQCIPLSISVLICQRLAKLFQLFERGYLFEKDNIKLIKSISLFMILGQVLQLVYQPLMGIVLSFNNPVGERFASLSLGTSNLTTFITALIILVASWIVQEAQQLKSEAQLTI